MPWRPHCQMETKSVRWKVASLALSVIINPIRFRFFVAQYFSPPSTTAAQSSGCCRRAATARNGSVADLQPTVSR